MAEARIIEMMGLKVLVCGGRDFTDYRAVAFALNRLSAERGPIELIVHGAAKGADSLAQLYADTAGICCKRYPANWKRDGRMAGPIRNEQMLVTEKPDVVVAFPGGRGTADCVRRAKDFGIEVLSAAGDEDRRA